MEYSLKTYYERYLLDIRQLSKSSAAHYHQALRWISDYLKQHHMVIDSIFELGDMEQLNQAKEFLYTDKVFDELDKRGHHMYSAGLNNYLRFVNGSEFLKYHNALSEIDIPIPASNPSMQLGNVMWPISPIIKHQSLEMASYTCEVDSCHTTFTQKNTAHPYMEGHHLISMQKQLSFDISLDVYANIVCLCPTCHRLLHVADCSDATPVLQQIYHQRATRLSNSGIRISASEFLHMTIPA